MRYATGGRGKALSCVLLLLSTHAASAAETDASSPPGNAATAEELPQVVVIANTPLPGLGVPLIEVPANVQTADLKDMQRQQVLTVADYLNSNFSGINASESAANPYQLDVYYHGFTASPLLGTPEGLSVYVDGVRVNESFGDTVNWDLIPQSAISTVTLISGSNPVFGLNTLGGALSIRTKSGHDDPGTELEAYGGSFGRRAFVATTGGAFSNFDYFVTGNFFHETGWRQNSPSRVFQAFGKVGWETEETDLDLSYTYADTSLYGNGPTPLSMLDYNYESSYTPDYTANVMNFLNLTATQFLADKLLLSGNLYYRHLITNASNGNVNDSYLDNEDYVGPSIDCAVPAPNETALAYCSPGQNADGHLTQRTWGVGLELTDSRSLFGAENQITLGASYASSNDTFSQGYQYGGLTPDRLLIYTVSPYNNETVVSVGGNNDIYGAYLTDTLSPNKFLHLTPSVRYNRNTETVDGYSRDTTLGPGFNEVSPLAGNHSFERVNPALGFTVTPSDRLTLYADYNQASRAPTVIELGCANPRTPCGLPSDFASDPNLQQVVARTVELGLRGNTAEYRLTWSADLFRTVNRDDIQFVATATNAGYFANVGDTRREGLDLAIGGKEGGLNWHLAYSFVDATFQSPFIVNAASNSTANADGNIVVNPGNRIPLIPRNTARLALGYEFNQRWEVGGTVVAASGSFLHGNENNANQAGATNLTGAYIEGTGSVPGYVVATLEGSYHIARQVQLFARVANLFDKKYATAGFLTSNAFTASGAFIPNPSAWTNENAVSPAEPFGIWVGVRLDWK